MLSFDDHAHRRVTISSTCRLYRPIQTVNKRTVSQISSSYQKFSIVERNTAISALSPFADLQHANTMDSLILRSYRSLAEDLLLLYDVYMLAKNRRRGPGSLSEYLDVVKAVIQEECTLTSPSSLLFNYQWLTLISIN